MANVIEALRYMIGAAWEGETAVRKAKGDITDLGNTTATVDKKSKVNWSNLGKSVAGFGLAVGGAALAANQAYQLIGEGAELVKAEDQFDRLAASINTTGDALENKLRAASQGMVTDANLVAAANQIMNQSLADTEQGVVDLASVSSQLNWDMQILGMTLNNNSEMRLDQLNLSVERVRELKQVYVDAGMAAEDAFDAAVIAAGKEKIELLGNAADTTAGQMKIFETGIKNAQDEFKVELVRAFADGIADIAGNSDDAAKSLEAAAAGAGTLLGTLAAGTLGNLGVAIGDNLAIDFAVQRGEIDALEGAFRKFWGRQTPELKAQIELWAEMAEEYRQMGALSPEVAKDWRRGEAVISSAVDDMGDAAMRTIPKLSALLGTLGFISQAQWDFAVENGTNERRAPAAKTGPRARSLRMADVNLNEVARGLDGLDLGFSKIGRDVDEVTGGFGGWSGQIEDATSAIDELAMASGDLFSRLRGQKEFNLGEELFGLGDKAGWSALDMSKFGVTAGLFDQGRADELLNRSYLLQSAEQMIAGGLKGDELWGAVQGLQGQLGEGAGLATEFFGALDAATIRPDMDMNTDPALVAYRNLQTEIANNPLVATVRVNYENAVDAVVKTMMEQEPA